MRKIILTEARRWMSDRERSLKKLLIELLRDDGHGHHHAKYAERLESFDINIIPLRPDEPPVTAYISFDSRPPLICIGEGLVNNPSTLYQLPSVIRHELAHNLMMHEIRMMTHIGAEKWEELWGASPSLHSILNIVMDDEISNKKYTDYDKNIMRALILNGKEIQCLVTEDHRPEWVNLPLDKMFDAICLEMDDLNRSISQQIALNRTPDGITAELAQTMRYKNIHGASMIPGTLEKFIQNGGKIQTARGPVEFADVYKQVITTIYEQLEAHPISPQQVEDLLKEIANSHPTEALNLISPVTGEIIIRLTTPETKLFAVETLKKYRSEFSEWYSKVAARLVQSKYSSGKIREIFRRIQTGD